jgi:hypothetical protein
MRFSLGLKIEQTLGALSTERVKDLNMCGRGRQEMRKTMEECRSCDHSPRGLCVRGSVG